MVETILRALLGSAGSAVLDFYIANATIINLILFAYFGLLWLSRKSYRTIQEALKEQLSASGKSFGQRDEAWFRSYLEKNPIDWNAVEASSRFSFFSPEHYFWFHLKNEKAIRKYFTAQRIASWYQTQKVSSATEEIKEK